jgi:hypothetical protein
MENIKTIAQINGVNIQIIDNGEKRVAVRPICEALGIAYEAQYSKLKDDDILAPTIMLSMMVGNDGKKREMITILYKYVFGWLFTINPKNVAPEAQETVKKYRMECYDVLFKHFTEQSQFLKEKQEMINFGMDEFTKIQIEFKTAKKRMDEQKARLDKVRKMTFEEWKGDGLQKVIPFDFKDKEIESDEI